MQVLGDEPVLVLHPEEGKGFEVRISGLADDFQLHTLLADALIDPPEDGWITGRRPSEAEVEAARGGPIPMDGAAFWVCNEGVPADIPEFDGRRVVLLGRPPYERSWSPGRKFPDMTGDLRVERVLPTVEVRDLLGRVAAAVAAVAAEPS